MQPRTGGDSGEKENRSFKGGHQVGGENTTFKPNGNSQRLRGKNRGKGQVELPRRPMKNRDRQYEKKQHT